jgi:large-conductance mechanosensitive channel
MNLHKTLKTQAKDTGLAIVLILLIIEYLKHPTPIIIAAIAVLVLVMTLPEAFRPLAKVWFGFSHFLGLIVSKIILSIVFFLIVTPVGLLRRAFGIDPMKSSAWKKGKESVLIARNHVYVKEDLEKPY